MALWGFGRRGKHQESPPASETGAGPARSDQAVAIAPSSAPVRASARDEWKQLPPLARTSGEPRLTAPLSRITTGLAATADTGMVLAKLGHQLRRDAPAGRVSGTIVPTARTNATPRQPSGPTLDVARHTVRPDDDVQPIRWMSNGSPSRSAEEQPVHVRDQSQPPQSTLSTPSLPTTPTVAAPLPDASPARRLNATTSRIVTDAAPRTGLAVVQRPSMIPAPGPSDPVVSNTTTTLATPATPTTAGSRRPVHVAASSAPSSTDDVVPTQELSAPPEPAPLSGQRTIHRRRLGEPLVHRPSTMVAAVRNTTELPSSTVTRGAEPVNPAEPVRQDSPPKAATRNALPVRLARPSAVVSTSSGSGPRHDGHAAGDGRKTPSLSPTTSIVGHRPSLPARRSSGSDGGSPSSDNRMAVSVTPRANSTPVVVPITRRSQATLTPPIAADRGVPTPPEADPTAGPRPRPARSRPDGVPSDLRAQLEPMLGTDLSDVPVHRGASSSRAASEMRAKAFTVGSEVHIPEKLGPLSHGEGRETLAHELTHVAQQRRLGAVQPNEDSPAGQRMEADARAVATRVSNSSRVSVAPPAPRRPVVPMVHTPAPSSARLAATSPTAPASSLSTAEAWNVAADIERAALSSGMATKLPAGGVTFGGSAPTAAASAGVQRLPEGEPTTTPSHHANEVATSVSSTVEMTPDKIDELASRVYEGIRSRLRHDLLLQRERSGTLFDRR